MFKPLYRVRHRAAVRPKDSYGEEMILYGIITGNPMIVQLYVSMARKKLYKRN